MGSHNGVRSLLLNFVLSYLIAFLNLDILISMKQLESGF